MYLAGILLAASLAFGQSNKAKQSEAFAPTVQANGQTGVGKEPNGGIVTGDPQKNGQSGVLLNGQTAVLFGQSTIVVGSPKDGQTGVLLNGQGAGVVDSSVP